MDVELRVNPERKTTSVYAKKQLKRYTVIPEKDLIEKYGDDYNGYYFGEHGFNTIELPNEDALTIKNVPKGDELLMPPFFNRDLNIALTPEKYLPAALRKMKRIKVENCDCPTCVEFVKQLHPFYDPITKALRIE